MIKRTVFQASYSGTVAEWDELADRLDAAGETRTARAIRNAIDRERSGEWSRFSFRDYAKQYGRDWPVSLRFRGGTIAKLDALING